ncbi:MAG: sigma-70 family RNA polymerase sigma factor [Chromatiales bacterium]|nr:sigma-70 family RNA polymerase sigma factor [Chromatiales bacterium]
MSDAEVLAGLLARCALGDRAAFAELYQRTSAHLFGLVVRILRRNDTAEEVLQDVYIRVWTHAADYRADRAQASTWLATIARNRALDEVRRRGREAPLPDDVIDTLDDAGPGPAQQAESQSTARALDDCLDQLPPGQRHSLVLAYCEGYTHSELSERLAQPLGTVKSWIRRGLDWLRECLGE